MVSWISIANLSLILLCVYYARPKGASGTLPPPMTEELERLRVERDELKEDNEYLKRENGRLNSHIRAEGQAYIKLQDKNIDLSSQLYRVEEELSEVKEELRSVKSGGMEEEIERLESENRDMRFKLLDLNDKLSQVAGKDLIWENEKLKNQLAERKMEVQLGERNLNRAKKEIEEANLRSAELERENKRLKDKLDEALNGIKKLLNGNIFETSLAPTTHNEGCELAGRAVERISISLFLAAVYEISLPTEIDLSMSPISLFIIILMVVGGQSKEKQTMTLRHMSIEDCSYDDILKQFSALLYSLQESGEKLKLGNVVFSDRRMPKLQEPYESTMENFLNVIFERKNFDDAIELLADVNHIMKEISHGQIDDFYTADMAEEASNFLLLSTMFMKTEWVEPFDKDKTYIGIFNEGKPTEKLVEYMTKTAMIRYLRSEEFKCAITELSYAEPNGLKALIFLPDEDITATMEAIRMKNFLKGGYTFLRQIINDMEERKVSVVFPKFVHTSNTYDYHSIFKKLLGDQFQFADNMYKDYVANVDKVYHKTKVTFDEVGSTISSVTATGTAREEEEEDDVLYFNVKYTFFYLIVIDKEGIGLVVIAAGVVTNPQAFI